MKKMYNFRALVAAMACTALALGSLNSCVVIDNINPDVEISYSLTGDWNGDFGMYYDYYDRHGRFVETFDCYDTDISFYPDYDYATHGYGYQVDFYRYGPYTKIYHSFEWEIHNCDVYLYYIGERELDTVIRDYRLSSSYFTGYFNDSNTRFSLRKYRDYYDWDPYWDDYGTYNHGTGYGYQVDFYEHGPYTKIFHTFDWEIRNEAIYLYYQGEPELNTIIYDYTLGRTRFTGRFDNASSRFTLKKYNDYYDWRDYCNDGNRYGFFYYYRSDWYYDDSMYGTRSNAAAIDTAALKADGQEFTIRYGNRFNQ